MRTDDGNVALGKATYCSTPDPAGCNVESFLRAAKAVDGNYGGDDDWYVKWFPNGGTPQWLTVDLGAPHAIASVEWFPAVEDVKARRRITYKIETSDDNKTWTYSRTILTTRSSDILPPFTECEREIRKVLLVFTNRI